jgi:hypothetical protein
MKPALPAIIIAPLILDLGYARENTFQSPTAVSILVEAREQQPTAVFKAAPVDPSYLSALDWLELSKVVLPDARPLTAEERSSINEFFWSHF